jgi:hypothetical protein
LQQLLDAGASCVQVMMMVMVVMILRRFLGIDLDPI